MPTFVIAEDHALVREGLALRLSLEPGWEVIGETGDGSEVEGLVVERRPDVLILDLQLDGMQGLEVCTAVRRRLPEQLILVLTANPEADVARRALDAGADGYLIKRGDGAELVHAIRTLLDGSGYISDDIGREVVSGAGKTDTPVDALSPRERHVLALIAAGHGSREIADQLSISVGTVRKHRENLMQKLDLHSIAEVTSFAIKNGLYTPPRG